MIEFLAAHRFNTFLYSPKDDPFLRDRWREPHTAEPCARLRSMIDRCHDNDVTAMVGVSPGLSMQYSSADDRAGSIAKVLGLVDAGVDHLALLFDDIPSRSSIPPTSTPIARWPRRRRGVEPRRRALGARSIPLVVCPTIYHGEGR